MNQLRDVMPMLARGGVSAAVGIAHLELRVEPASPRSRWSGPPRHAPYEWIGRAIMVKSH